MKIVCSPAGRTAFPYGTRSASCWILDLLFSWILLFGPNGVCSLVWRYPLLSLPAPFLYFYETFPNNPGSFPQIPNAAIDCEELFPQLLIKLLPWSWWAALSRGSPPRRVSFRAVQHHVPYIGRPVAAKGALGQG